MKRGLVALAALLALTGCGVLAPGSSGSSKFTVDTPALRALKASAHIQDCPRTLAPATGDLPNATLPCLGGGPSVSLSALRGPMVVNVWATSCFPCRDEMPRIEAFAKKYTGRVSVLGVDWEDQPSQALELAKALGVTYPLIEDSNPLADPPPVFRTAALPLTYLIDSNGKVVYKQAIALTSESQLEQLVAKYLGIPR